MRVEQSFEVRRPPAEVFAYMTDPANLASWQPPKVSVQPLTEGPPRLGYRVKERTKMGLRQWDQVVEFTEFVPGRVFGTHIVDGSVPVDGRWTFADVAARGPAWTSSPPGRCAARAIRTASRRRSRAWTSTTRGRRSTAAAIPILCRAWSAR